MLDCPVWTEDADFFGTGVATWTTGRVKLNLAPEDPAATDDDSGSQNRPEGPTKTTSSRQRA